MLVLVNPKGEPVTFPYATIDFRGEPVTVTGATPPHKPDSTGSIDTDQGNFYPSVCNLKWVEANLVIHKQPEDDKGSFTVEGVEVSYTYNTDKDTAAITAKAPLADRNVLVSTVHTTKEALFLAIRLLHGDESLDKDQKAQTKETQSDYPQLRWLFP